MEVTTVRLGPWHCPAPMICKWLYGGLTLDIVLPLPWYGSDCCEAWPWTLSCPHGMEVTVVRLGPGHCPALTMVWKWLLWSLTLDIVLPPWYGSDCCEAWPWTLSCPYGMEVVVWRLDPGHCPALTMVWKWLYGGLTLDIVLPLPWYRSDCVVRLDPGHCPAPMVWKWLCCEAWPWTLSCPMVWKWLCCEAWPWTLSCPMVWKWLCCEAWPWTLSCPMVWKWLCCEAWPWTLSCPMVWKWLCCEAWPWTLSCPMVWKWLCCEAWPWTLSCPMVWKWLCCEAWPWTLSCPHGMEVTVWKLDPGHCPALTMVWKWLLWGLTLDIVLPPWCGSDCMEAWPWTLSCPYHIEVTVCVVRLDTGYCPAIRDQTCQHLHTKCYCQAQLV